MTRSKASAMENAAQANLRFEKDIELVSEISQYVGNLPAPRRLQLGIQ